MSLNNGVADITLAFREGIFNLWAKTVALAFWSQFTNFLFVFLAICAANTSPCKDEN